MFVCVYVCICVCLFVCLYVSLQTRGKSNKGFLLKKDDKALHKVNIRVISLSVTDTPLVPDEAVDNHTRSFIGMFRSPSVCVACFCLLVFLMRIAVTDTTYSVYLDKVRTSPMLKSLLSQSSDQIQYYLNTHTHTHTHTRPQYHKQTAI